MKDRQEYLWKLATVGPVYFCTKTWTNLNKFAPVGHTLSGCQKQIFVRSLVTGFWTNFWPLFVEIWSQALTHRKEQFLSKLHKICSNNLQVRSSAFSFGTDEREVQRRDNVINFHQTDKAQHFELNTGLDTNPTDRFIQQKLSHRSWGSRYVPVGPRETTWEAYCQFQDPPRRAETGHPILLGSYCFELSTSVDECADLFQKSSLIVLNENIRWCSSWNLQETTKQRKQRTRTQKLLTLFYGQTQDLQSIHQLEWFVGGQNIERVLSGNVRLAFTDKLDQYLSQQGFRFV